MNAFCSIVQLKTYFKRSYPIYRIVFIYCIVCFNLLHSVKGATKDKIVQGHGSATLPRAMNDLTLTNFNGIDLCLQYGCRRFKHLIGNINSCSGAFQCGSCERTTSFKSTTLLNQFCQDHLKLSKKTFILADGYYESTAVLQGSFRTARRESTDASIQWSSFENLVDITRCALDDFTTDRIPHIIQSQSAKSLTFHVRLYFLVSIFKVKKDLFTSPLQLTLNYHADDTEEDTLSSNWEDTRVCPKSTFVFPLDSYSYNSNMENGDLITSIHSVSIPWDQTHSIETSNFKLTLSCVSMKNCNLSNYEICARIVCPVMTNTQHAGLLALQNIINYPMKLEPLPSIPPELLKEEYI